MLGISSGEEWEDKSPPLKTHPWEKLPDPAQGRSTKHLWALGRSRLWHRRRQVIGLGQPGLKIEMPLDEGRLEGCLTQAWVRGEMKRYLKPGISQVGR